MRAHTTAGQYPDRIDVSQSKPAGSTAHQRPPRALYPLRPAFFNRCSAYVRPRTRRAPPPSERPAPARPDHRHASLVRTRGLRPFTRPEHGIHRAGRERRAPPIEFRPCFKGQSPVLPVTGAHKRRFEHQRRTRRRRSGRGLRRQRRRDLRFVRAPRADREKNRQRQRRRSGRIVDLSLQGDPRILPRPSLAPPSRGRRAAGRPSDAFNSVPRKCARGDSNLRPAVSASPPVSRWAGPSLRPANPDFSDLTGRRALR